MPLINTRRLKKKAPLPGWEGRFFHSENMTFGYYTVKAGASIHPHAHEEEEVWNVVEGQFEITLDGKTVVAGPGYAAVVPPNTTHSVRALSDGRAIIVDHPVRRSIGGVDLD